jgi:hypothetical protein
MCVLRKWGVTKKPRNRSDSYSSGIRYDFRRLHHHNPQPSSDGLLCGNTRNYSPDRRLLYGSLDAVFPGVHSLWNVFSLSVRTAELPGPTHVLPQPQPHLMKDSSVFLTLPNNSQLHITCGVTVDRTRLKRSISFGTFTKHQIVAWDLIFHPKLSRRFLTLRFPQYGSKMEFGMWEVQISPTTHPTKRHFFIQPTPFPKQSLHSLATTSGRNHSRDRGVVMEPRVLAQKTPPPVSHPCENWMTTDIFWTKRTAYEKLFEYETWQNDSRKGRLFRWPNRNHQKVPPYSLCWSSGFISTSN